MQNGKTSVVAGIKQEAKGDTRTGLPFIGMIPLLGRFFTTPRQTSSLSDIVITVTPHILRSPELKQEDHLARFSGTLRGGATPTIEEVIFSCAHKASFFYSNLPPVKPDRRRLNLISATPPC